MDADISTTSSGHSSNTTNGTLSQRKNNSHAKQPSIDDPDLQEIIHKTLNLNINHSKGYANKAFPIFTNYISPLILTAISAYVRLYRIEVANRVVWDEAHFGKFGSHYLQHEFYFDVHPPLGKLLVGLSGYLAGYDGKFDFDSGQDYPENVNYIFMRIFNCVFGILCTPLAYKTSMLLGFSQLTCWFIALLVTFEMLSLTLSKFILLDSMLLFFTVFSFFCLSNIHLLRTKNKLLSFKGIKWMLITGVSIGCVCSVKWVGLFVTLLIGFYIIYDLAIKFYQTISPKRRITWKEYISHWIVRIITLIIIPTVIYMAVFKIHFTVLNRPGPDDGSISTLLQASLKGSNVNSGPRTVLYGSLVTMRSQGLSPNLLHSHAHYYPEGSGEQQVTTYGYKDENNEFILELDINLTEQGKLASECLTTTLDLDECKQLIKDQHTIRIRHNMTGLYLHPNALPAPVSKSHYEVSCYGNASTTDLADEWIIEIQSQHKSPSPLFANETVDEVHPISTNFRLKNKQLGCYLATTGYSYPSWGFNQGEVVCKYAYFSQDKNTWWNVEKHVNNHIEEPKEKYVPPRPKFWKEFVLLNYGMMASNNALVADPDKLDKLTSEWWEWPALKTRLRMCSWGADDIKFYLMGNPFVTWLSCVCLISFVVYLVRLGYSCQRQVIQMDVLSNNWNRFIGQGMLPFVGWCLHYFPFMLMGRVTYLHHYVPALYFAIFVSGFIIERVLANIPKSAGYLMYCLLYLGIVGTFWYFREFSFGMEGSAKNFQHLQLLSTWTVY